MYVFFLFYFKKGMDAHGHSLSPGRPLASYLSLKLNPLTHTHAIVVHFKGSRQPLALLMRLQKHSGSFCEGIRCTLGCMNRKVHCTCIGSLIQAGHTCVPLLIEKACESAPVQMMIAIFLSSIDRPSRSQCFILCSCSCDGLQASQAALSASECREAL